jgi:hypothetical protein
VWLGGGGIGKWVWFPKWSDEKDFYRYQMWNFISQMHAGGDDGYKKDPDPSYEWVKDNYLSKKRHAKYPVTSIDAPAPDSDYDWDCFDWTKYSFNYRVDLPPPPDNPIVSVFQLHTFGGDSQDGRDDGTSWLDGQLLQIFQDNPRRPIIIIQHFPLSPAKPGYGWTDAKRDDLLGKLSLFNVLAFLTGHTHSMNDFPKLYPYPKILPYPSSGYKDFTAGICSVDYKGAPAQPSGDRGCFALVRITENTFDIVHGHLNGSKDIVWDRAYSKPVANPGGPYDLCGEGSPVTFDGTNSSGRIVEYKWDLDGDGSYETVAEAPIHTWMDDYVGEVKLRIEDDFYESATATAQVTVVNVAPEVVVGEPFAEILRGHTFTRAAAFTDPGEDDPWVATVDYGDGSDEQALMLRPDKTFTLSHVYPVAGQYTLTVTVRDKDGGEGEGTISVNVRKPRIKKLKIGVSVVR